MVIEEAVREFLLDGQASGWAASTIRQYRWHLDKWTTWMQCVDVHDTGGISRQHLRRWSADIANLWKPATHRTAVVAVRSFLRWCDSEGISGDLWVGLRKPKVPVKVQRTLTSEEVYRLLAAAAVPSSTGVDVHVAKAVAYRNQAIISILFDCWLRSAELCSLDVDDVSTRARRLLVVGKGGSEYLVPFSQPTADRIGAWLSVRGIVANPGEPAFFVGAGGSKPGTRFTTEGLRGMLRKVGDRAGVPGVSPHAFRRGGATEAIRNGAPTRWVQMHGRWSRLEMVERYTLALDADAMFEEYSVVKHMTPEP